MLLFAFGQLLVALVEVSWLPPMQSWYSGLMPYAYLLPTQCLIIGLYSKVCIDFTRNEGFFVKSRPVFGRGVLVFGYLYLASMIVRYTIHMSLYPEARWFGGTIPIFFHGVLASFTIAFGLYHRNRLTHQSGLS
jgi:hypothetical protein